MKKQIIAAIAVLTVCTGIFSFKIKNSADLPRAVKTEAGLVSGADNITGDIVAFKGIPFAAPPVCNLRWKAPQPAPHWQGVKACTAFGPSPMQGKPTPFFVWTSEFLIPEEPIAEDCLYLNVWAKKENQHKKPVMVWIYGGGFGSGGAGVPIYDGEAMAKKDVVFVSINYRVGAFGFFSHPELSKESPEHSSGNYGLLDQIAALQWVKKNIAAFGGDADNVTIMGQSAGSMSVNILVASPAAKGLFHKAIAESGSMVINSATRHMDNLQTAEQAGLESAQKAGATSLDELRKMPAADVLAKLKGRFSPIADGYVLPQPVYQIFADNKQNNVPLITGWNADEGIVSGFKTKEEFVKDVQSRYGKDAEAVLKLYPANTYEEAANSQVQLNRDLTFALSGYQWARLQSGRQVSPVYLYNFTRRPPAEGEYVKYKSFHTGEVAYALDNLKFLHRPWQPVDEQLAKTMSAYWVNFAKTGNPNGSGLPLWPKFETQNNKVIVLGKKDSAQALLNKQRLDFMLALEKR